LTAPKCNQYWREKMASDGSCTPLILNFHAETCLVKIKEQSASLTVVPTLPADR
jgi:hypothetical protein